MSILSARIIASTTRDLMREVMIRNTRSLVEVKLPARHAVTLKLDPVAEVLVEGREAVALLPVSKDAYFGADRVINLAAIYAMVGETDLAVDQLEVPGTGGEHKRPRSPAPRASGTGETDSNCEHGDADGVRCTRRNPGTGLIEPTGTEAGVTY
jgi:hypothetical protein